MIEYPFDCELILASQSPRRKQLLANCGLNFRVIAPDDSVECGACSTQSPTGLVMESSFLKARFVAQSLSHGLVLAADTVAECHGQVLGKPADQAHAEQMLRLMSGQRHSVLTGVTLWHQPSGIFETHIERTLLVMDALSERQLFEYLETEDWVGKAGAFGYQDGLDWVHVVAGLESNVVGLPVERLSRWFRNLKAKVDAPV